MSVDDGARIRVDSDPSLGRSRLILSGRVTVADAGELHRAAVGLAARGHGVTVDCAGAEYLDTSAVQLLLALTRELKTGGRPCEVVGPSAAVREDFRLAGFRAAP